MVSDVEGARAVPKIFQVGRCHGVQAVMGDSTRDRCSHMFSLPTIPLAFDQQMDQSCQT